MVNRKRVRNSRFFIRISFFFFGLLLAPLGHTQSLPALPERLTADIVDTKGMTQNLIGNVKLRHRGVLLFCDQAVHDVSTHSVRAYGHVLVVQGDSVTARGDSATFTYSNRHLLIYGRVMFQDHRTILTTTQLDYDVAAGIVTYSQKGRLVNDKNVLTSRGGTYNLQLKQFACQQAVQLATRKNTTRAESLVYNTATQQSTSAPKDISPVVTEPRMAENQPVRRTANSIVSAVAPQPIAEQIAVVTVPVLVTKAAAAPKSTVSSPAPVIENSSKPVGVTRTGKPRITQAAMVSSQPQPKVVFSPATYKPSAPALQQAVQPTSAKSPVSSYVANPSDLEIELNKKKRFH